MPRKPDWYDWYRLRILTPKLTLSTFKEYSLLRPIYTRVRFCIRLVCVSKKAEIYEQANLLRNRHLKLDV